MKYLLTGRNVKLTEDQRNACAKQYTSLRAFAYENQIELSRLIATFCAPDAHGGVAESALIVSCLNDLQKDQKTNKNECMQLINTAGDALTIFRYAEGKLSYIKKRNQFMPVVSILNKLQDPIPDMKLALVQQKWSKHQYDEYLPCTEYGTTYAVELQNAVRRVMSLMHRSMLDHLELVADSFTQTVQNILWIAGQTQTEVTFTWIAEDGRSETNVWKQPMDLREFLSCFTDLNVFRYVTLDEKGQRVTRYSRPQPYHEDLYPVDHTDNEPYSDSDKTPHFLDAEMEQQFEEALHSGIEVVSYDQLMQKAYEASDAGDMDTTKVRKGIFGLLTPVKQNRDYAPHIIGHYKGYALVCPVNACEPQLDGTLTYEPGTGKLVHRPSGSGCDLCGAKGSDFCKTCPNHK